MNDRELKTGILISKNEGDLIEHHTRKVTEEWAYIEVDRHFNRPIEEEQTLEGTEMTRDFVEWLLSPVDKKAKDKALKRKFYEILDKADPDITPLEPVRKRKHYKN